MTEKPTSSENNDEEKEDQSASSLKEKLEDISSRLSRIERVLAQLEPEMGEFKQSTRLVREGMEFYGHLFDLMGHLSGMQRLQRRFPELEKDEISRLIVEALAAGNPMNISQLTLSVRRKRGTASRRIVRERILHLIELGIVEESHKTKKASYYRLAEGLLSSQV